MQEREHVDQPQPEIVINRSSSRDGQVGWRIGLIRRDGESEGLDAYTQRCIAKHRELERELTTRVCCHDADGGQDSIKEGSRP